MTEDQEFTTPSLAFLRNSSLREILFDPIGLGMKCHFTFGPTGEDVIIQLHNILHFGFSRSLEDREGDFFVGDVQLIKLNETREEILNSIKYPFYNPEGQVLTYRDTPLFHFRVEGGTVIDAICVGYQIFEQKS